MIRRLPNTKGQNTNLGMVLNRASRVLFSADNAMAAVINATPKIYTYNIIWKNSTKTKPLAFRLVRKEDCAISVAKKKADKVVKIFVQPKSKIVRFRSPLLNKTTMANSKP